MGRKPVVAAAGCVGLLVLALSAPLAAIAAPPSQASPPPANHTAWHPVSPADQERIASRMADLLAAAARRPSFGALVLRAGLSWLGTPYQRSTLDEVQPEALVLRTDVLGCMTLVELSLAMARAAACGRGDLPAVQAELQALRYRGGRIAGYGSRLHYTSEWLEQASAAGALRDLTVGLGGQPLRRRFDYMSRQPQRYPPLADPQALAAIRATEAERSGRTYHLLPAGAVAARHDELRAGDLISIATSSPGLLVSHIGLVSPMDDGPHLLHASSAYGHTGTSVQTVAGYLARRPERQGILVHRPLPPACAPDQRAAPAQ